jgi:predicted Zn-dependent protease
VALPITEAARGQADVASWEVVVFREESANAFALPGGKIGVHTGLLKVAKTDGQLAAVLGHEVGHVIARHGAERVSSGMATQGGLAAIDAFILGKSVSGGQRQLILGGLGLASQVGVLLLFSRSHESEADLIGLDLMSRAGFDPRQSVELWRNMAAAGGGQPPQWLSTHPSHETRISALQAGIPESLRKYEAAQAGGKRPSCSR